MEWTCIKCGESKDSNLFINKKTCKSCKYAYRKLYYQRNKQKECNKMKDYRTRNAVQIAANKKEYAVEHKEHIRQYKKEYRRINKTQIAAKKKAYSIINPNVNIMKNHNRMLSRVFEGKAQKSNVLRIIGCSWCNIRDWFYFQMFLYNDGKTFDNYGGVWSIDHVIPVSSFDLTREDQLKKCYHWSNLRPLSSQRNMVKGFRLSEHTIDTHNWILKLYTELNNIPLIQLNK